MDDRAAILLKHKTDPLRARIEGHESAPGYIWIIPGGTHGSIFRQTRERWPQEMREHLRQAGF